MQRDLTPHASAAAHRPLMPRAQFVKVLRRAGYSATQAQFVLGDLPDPIDFGRDGQALLRKGVTLDRLTDSVGGSP